ncbi:MAG: bifunctional (p)ppGpp synthetase/guanosine-3',5'-bis(diphosphate) 3'-pyrophosphohydrolase [Caldilineaceae bacterium]|nr:bifunctional (p)ppGpp synthetase/guanosine-3',5'-bis(diphosphate) 3'-pyrophosphohydrolase [Caldilineaceae bacterium]
MNAHDSTLERAFRLVEQVCAPDTSGESVQAARIQGNAVAHILDGWQAGLALQAAGLLHRLVCVGAVTPADVTAACGPRVASLCEDFLCLSATDAERKPRDASAAPSSAAFQFLDKPAQWPGRHVIYQRIRAYCAAYKDAELGFLQAAVLWHRFHVAAAGGIDRGVYREEATQLLGPFLEMLGMRQLRGELAEWLQRTDDSPAENPWQPLLDAIVTRLAVLLPTAIFDTQDTQTHIFEAYNTSFMTQREPQGLTVEILVDDEEECYAALHQIHHMFLPVENALTDNIGAGRVNGYRSIQTSVMVPVSLPKMPADVAAARIKHAAREQTRRQRINFRIATRTMDEINRWGMAAFLLRERLDDQLASGWWQNASAGYAQITSAPLGSLPPELFVFSPHGQLFRFERGCTVVDYAYHVHSELADRCSRFYVNGLPVEPATVLHHLDLVELEHDPLAPGPTQVWLDAAQTSRARSKIDRHLKRSGQGVYQGQRIVAQRRKALEEHFGFNMPEHRVNQAIAASMRRLKLTRTEELYAEIAAGRWAVDRMLHRFFAEEVIRQVDIPRDVRIRPQQIQLAQCCLPRPGDDIVGRLLRRRGVVTGLKIHRSDCPKFGGHVDPAHPPMPLRWRLQPKFNTLVRVEMSALDEHGLLGDAVEQIYAQLPRVTLHKVEASTRQGIATLRFTIEAEGMDVIETIVDELRRMPQRNIDRVQILHLPPSEQEEILARPASGNFNPYSRLPVHDREMFFGRAHDLARVMDWLQSGAGSIWLRGQKRVGKTSLLLHLKRFYLEEQGFVPIFIDFQLLGSMDERAIFFEIASAVYSELQDDASRADLRLGDVGAPLRELFEHDPRGQFIAYLRGIQRRLRPRRLVLMLDEFSRTIDAFQHERMNDAFFHQWRGVMLATMPHVSYVTVVQQKSYDMLTAQRAQEEVDPIWELLELGEQLPLRPLDEYDVRRLIEWPIRNVLEYPPEVIEYVARLTGGSPFLIQAFCFKLVTHMARADHRQVTWADVDMVLMDFMQPNESLFSHLLDLVHGLGHVVTQALAQSAEDDADGIVTTAQLAAACPTLDEATLLRTLHELAAQDIIVAVEPEGWRFANQIFGQWLALNVPQP